ncbi:hypothetical protein SNE510_39340 [Streptomyces sp. NE5-10]|uniref:DUF4190 domain-containing protein n=1 Tax=Streptomyces sp. NE5-10 TaxID=2759674 RepID=UPI0019044EC9|nr:DUF4190 domain-containing protein [Streptomyces sp. NE5-10]GHJ94415.1 hypothetical protein SNE510_39340 [Streptomyces sp. NE5-10]
MSENADPRPQDREASDPWAPPERRNEPVELGKRPAADPPVHDRPTVASIPVGDPAGGELPPPPVAPGGPSAYGAPTPPPSYGYPAAGQGAHGHPAAGSGAYGYPAAGPGAYGYPPAYPSPYGPVPGQYNGMGTAGMVLGIIGTCLFWFYGVPSIVLGVLALIFGILGRKRAHRGEASNGGAATAGIVLGIVSAVLGAAVIALVVWAVVSYDEYEESEREGTTTSAVLVLGDR